ncbi:MAG: tetratricopeptide repeat protein [Bacteroidales bacterium]|nr:tetratricopeptide repeat protein [Bacteroidales bacterium]
MKQRWWIFVLLINALFVLPMSGQISSSPKGKKVDAQQREQIKIDEQLASQYYREQDYEKARDLYGQLFEKAEQVSHFQQYIECLILLKDYDKAEKELKSFAKKRPSYYKADADLIYVYTLQDKTDKAKKRFNEILKDLPDNATTIRNISYALQARSLNDMAMAILEKGNKLLEGKETFYMDQANLNLSTANYQEAFRYYFQELETHPGQYNNIRNRLQTMMFYDVNHSISDDLRMALLKQTQDKPDNLDFAQLLVWFALQQEDYDIALAQCQSIDRKTHDQDAQINNLSGICLNNKQYDIAKEGYNYILDKGKSNPFYGQALTGIINADYLKLKAENHTDTKAYERLSKRIDEAYNEISTNDLSKLTLIQADIMTYQLGKSEDAIALLSQAIEDIGNKQGKAELKLKLADIYLNRDEVWEATLLYSQVDKSLKEEPLGHEARFKNAQLRYFIGEYEWAESQLKVLKAATSKLIANDAMTLSLVIKDNLEVDTLGLELNRLARADYRIYQQREDEALVLLDDIIATGNEISKPHALFRKGEIVEKRKDFAQAEQLFLQIVEQFPDSYMADAALMHAALIEQNQLKDKTLAGEHYEKLIDEYPTSIYTAQAKKNYRKL